MTAGEPDIAARRKKKYPNQAIRYFVRNMRIVWMQEIGRSVFTIARHGGLLEGAGANFCLEFLNLIDPDASRSQFATAIREAVELNHFGRGRRPCKSRKHG
jgi:hypothetical protein